MMAVELKHVGAF